MSPPWYQSGLRFTCTQCGHCCTGEPGFVWVDDADLAAIAEHRGETIDEVRGLYTRWTAAAGPCAKRPTAIASSTTKTPGVSYTLSGRRSAAPGRSGRATSPPPKRGNRPVRSAPDPVKAS